MILDTNALSAFADGNADLLGVIGTRTPEVAVPVIVLGEYLFGVQQSHFRDKYETWLKDHLPEFVVLGVGPETALHYAEVRLELKASGRPIPTNDVWIAALAREHRLGIVTRDRHFGAVTGLRVVAW